MMLRTKTRNCGFNFSFFLKRNVSSERSEARRKLRECTGLVDSLMYIVQSQISRKDVDNKVPHSLLADSLFLWFCGIQFCFPSSC